MNVDKSSDILKEIFDDNGLIYKSSNALSGGDINQVYLVESASEKYVVKLNSAQKYPSMFEKEKLGLEKLYEPGVIDVPHPIATGNIQDFAYLILEHKAVGQKKSDFWQKFGESLAALHRTSKDYFGLETDNYIGSLPQYNEKKQSAAEFYIQMRLQPQIEMAEKNGFKLKVSDSFYKNCEQLIPSEKSSLVHGDLWNGNYIVNPDGLPCLIDPAVAFAPREMDLGMMKLFGGFSDELFQVYDEIFPLETGWRERIPLWQLYYLLVHLNIFGAGYKSQVSSIISKFS